MNILIVDDSRFFRLANERALTKAGYQVISAGDGEEGLRLAREHRPDLIVLDMMLPLLGGPSVLRELRKDPQTFSIPVMVLSSLPKTNEGKLLRDGATAYFEKSGLMLDKGSEILVEEVQRMLSQAGACEA
jgi:two-component system chemotaxis response regulator CheY